MDKYQNKYRIPSARLQSWDYASEAAYFVTICTHDRQCFFGDVVDGKIVLSNIGEIVSNEWFRTFEMRPDMRLQMGEFVVMPNHFHSIIIIGENEFNTTLDIQPQCRDAMPCVSDNTVSDNAVLHTNCPNVPIINTDTMQRGDAKHCVSTTNTTNQFGPQFKNLSSIIRGFKTAVTKNARSINPGFAWQTRFYDHIIRDAQSYDAISDYIINNPVKWNDDVLNPLNNATERLT